MLWTATAPCSWSSARCGLCITVSKSSSRAAVSMPITPGRPGIRGGTAPRTSRETGSSPRRYARAAARVAGPAPLAGPEVGPVAAQSVGELLGAQDYEVAVHQVAVLVPGHPLDQDRQRVVLGP